MLEHGGWKSPNGRFPQISWFEFTYDDDLPPGDRVTSVEDEAGNPIMPDSTV